MPNPPKADLVLVDGSSYLYRAFHALPPLSNSRGEPTGAVYGVVNMMNRFIKDYSPDCIAVVFDAAGRTFRDEIFAEYKQGRPAMPNDLRAQIAPLLAVLEAQGLPVLRVEGVEADDVIGTLACRAAAAGRRVLISTSDKDMAQLVNGSITLVNTMSDTTLDRDGVKAKFDVWPEQIVDYLALVGDSSDNIPGVPKVGPKTAAKWLNQYGSLDQLIANAAHVEGKIGDNLRDGLTTLELSRKLATIRTDLDLPLEIEDCKPKTPDKAALRELYTQLELRAFLRQLDGEGGAEGPRTASPPTARATGGDAGPIGPAQDPDLLAEAAALARLERRYETLTSWADFERWLAKLVAAELFAFEVLTSSSDYMQAEIIGVSFAVEPGAAAYVPLRHRYAGVPDQLDRERVLGALKPLLQDPERGKCGHHLKFDLHALRNHGIELAGMRYDTMLESYVLNSVGSKHDLDATALAYLGLQTVSYEDVAGKGAKQLPCEEVPVERAAQHASEAADLALRLHGALWPRICRTPRLQALYEEIEQPLAPVLARMERRGVLLDVERLKTQSRAFATQLHELMGEARKAAGYDFNLESPRQLQQVLFEKLGLPVLRKTPTGQPSTAEDVLEELAEQNYTLPRVILEYRALAKLKGTYTDKLPELVNPDTGRVHTCYHQAVAQTGRLSSVDPNLQNIPIRRPEGRAIRQAFVPPPGHVLMAADYSQIELRIMAHLSGDDGLLAAFANDIDVHQATAAEVFGMPLDAVTADQRRVAKMINFGLIYGMSAFGLAQRLGLERGAAQTYVDRYFQRYPGVKRYMDETRRQAREAGYVETVYGRRLYLPDIRSRNKQIQGYAERAAINAPMQGTAADIIKRAMIAVDSWCERERAPARLIMQVHDELVLEVPEKDADAVAASIRERMAGAAELRVPLRIDVGIGANWDEAH